MKAKIIKEVMEYLGSYPKEERQVVAIDFAMTLIDNIPASQVDTYGILLCIMNEVTRTFNEGLREQQMVHNLRDKQN